MTDTALPLAMNVDTVPRNHSKPSLLSRISSFWPRLISPIAWWHCFALLYGPSSVEDEVQSNSTRRRLRSSSSLLFIFLHFALLALVGMWCYIYWMITFDGGQYLVLLSNVSSNKINITDGRIHFDGFIWRTALKTFFISLDFGLINACGVSLAAIWRRRICSEFYKLLFRSPNGCSLYETAQQSSYDLPTHLTNDIRQFTSNLSIALFGSLYFSGLIAVGTAVIVFSIYIVRETSGDTNGIAICFGAFGFSVLLVLFISYKYNRTAVEQLKAKGKIRSFLQQLQTNAESVAFYGSARRCEFVSCIKLNQIVHRWNVRAALWYSIVNIPIVFMGAVGGFITYILPALLFFFLRKSQEQTPTEATKYLGVIAFYGYVFWLLGSLIWITESCLIAVTLGDRLWKLKQRLIRLRSFHIHRLQQDEISGVKRESTDLVQLVQLRVIVPGEHEQRVLQSDINLHAARGECVLISGRTGCGKTSLFRICAGLWPIDARLVQLPARRQTIYIPQRPYLPIGSLRFQALFLLDIRYGVNDTLIVEDKQIRELFQLVNMAYLLDRYDLDTIVEWSACLSIGEQQRLSFVRLLALFTHRPDEASHILVMLDESTSAIDSTTEAAIFRTMLELHIWFITISHRPSLIKYHSKELNLHSSNTSQNKSTERNLNREFSDSMDSLPIEQARIEEEPIGTIDADLVGATRLMSMTSMTSTVYVETTKANKWLKDAIDVWRVIHLPFDNDSYALRIQTYIVWLVCLTMLGCCSYTSYRMTVQTGAIFNVLPDYAASTIDIAEARLRIGNLVWKLILLIIFLSILFSAQLGLGQLLGALYTRRQSMYIARLLLDDDDNQSTLYHTSSLKLLPSIISHDLAELNIQLFYLLIGSIYYNGLIGVLFQCIPYTILLAQQSGSGKAVLIVYLYQLFISSLILTVVVPYYRANVRFENAFGMFSNAQKRIDLQAEQIALSDRGVIEVEQAHLRSKLDASVREQRKSGYFYGLLVGCSVLGNWSSTIINYGIPAAIFFHLTSDPTAAQAASIVALTVYTGNLQGNLAVFNSHGQPFSQVWTIGRRIARNIEQLLSLREYHHDRRESEIATRQRVELLSIGNTQQPLLSFENVDLRIPTLPSSVLVRSLSFELDSHSSLLISGSSGCGKSTLLRLLAGLQYNATENSTLCVPARHSLVFLPQQLHLIEGTLREQMCYFRQAKGMSTIYDDQILHQLLAEFGLTHLIERYTLDSSVHIWSRTLSIGEQQRLLIIAALLLLRNQNDYTTGNKPIQCLILDETTAGCDEITERRIYERLRESRTQFISVSHRSQLIKYHTHQLVINPRDQSYELLQQF